MYISLCNFFKKSNCSLLVFRVVIVFPNGRIIIIDCCISLFSSISIRGTILLDKLIIRLYDSTNAIMKRKIGKKIIRSFIKIHDKIL